MFYYGALCFSLVLFSVTLSISLQNNEIICECFLSVNGEHSLRDLRIPIFTSESLFAVCLLILQIYDGKFKCLPKKILLWGTL